eukprot:TRINITY_DN32904_c0_g1_i1.p1 TRINITY_DN32904_c0_g1~~TRINITY_DN32904_c0_g1_i1.p1  ORF type:complete len:507 (+),score=58.81 TRINITY_DN32904_c0_g1_i1:151-1671(+)
MSQFPAIPCLDVGYNDPLVCEHLVANGGPWPTLGDAGPTAALGFCPPPGLERIAAAQPLCGPEENINSDIQQFEARLEKLQWQAVYMHQQFRLGDMTLIRSLLVGLEALRLTACTWHFRKCWSVAFTSRVREWWQLRLGHCRKIQSAFRVLTGKSTAYQSCPGLGLSGLGEAQELVFQLFSAFSRAAEASRKTTALRIPTYPAIHFGSAVCRWTTTIGTEHNPDTTNWEMSGLRAWQISIAEAFARIQKKGTELSYRLLNIGAMDGRCDGGPSLDPANCLLLQEDGKRWGGVVVEAFPPAVLFDRFARREDIKLVTQPMFPENASTALEGANVTDLDLLKIDIDSFDCDIVSVLLRTAPLVMSSPKLLYVDFNPHIPPPFLFRTTGGYGNQIVPLQGSSLQCFILAAQNYTLLHVELYNALFVRNDLVELFPEAARSPGEHWLAGYFCNPLTRTLWHREREIRWLGADPRLWADENRTLSERGESMLGVLGRMREHNAKFQFSLTW